MEHSEYSKMYQLEARYWWYVGRRSIIGNMIQKYAPQPKPSNLIVDIGCGTGMNASLLKQFGTVLGLDISPDALSFCRKRGFRNTALIKDASAVDLPDNRASLVTMLDVLEHTDDDSAVLKEVHRILKRDGIFIVTVPAYQFLWSEHDIALHHKRRYTTALQKLFQQNGFAIEKCSYAITFSFPIIATYRIIKGFANKLLSASPKTSHVMLPRVLNSFFVTLLKIEAFLLRYINFPFGTSVLVVARKSKSS